MRIRLFNGVTPAVDQPVDFIEILKLHFARRVAGNPRYSLRAYARDLGVSAPLLSGLFNGKKGLSEKSARLICQCLGLSAAQTKDFLLSVDMNFSRSPERRLAAKYERDRLLSRISSKTLLKDSELVDTANWIHLAILELCELPDCRHEPKWFADKLKIGGPAAGRAIKTLIDAKKLKFGKGRYVPTVGETTTEMDVPSPLIKKFHAEVLDRSKQSLYNDALDSREFLAVTLGFHQADVAEAKEMIRNFQEEFCDRFYRTSRRRRDSVYQLCVQLFPLTSSK